MKNSDAICHPFASSSMCFTLVEKMMQNCWTRNSYVTIAKETCYCMLLYIRWKLLVWMRTFLSWNLRCQLQLRYMYSRLAFQHSIGSKNQAINWLLLQSFAAQCFGLKFLKDCGSSTEQVSHCSTSVKISLLHWCSAPDHRLHRRPLKDGLRLKSFKILSSSMFFFFFFVPSIAIFIAIFSPIICVDLCAHFLAKMRWVAAIDSYAASGKRTLWKVPSLFLTVFPVVHLDADSNCSMWNCASTW